MTWLIRMESKVPIHYFFANRFFDGSTTDLMLAKKCCPARVPRNGAERGPDSGSSCPASLEQCQLTEFVLTQYWRSRALSDKELVVELCTCWGLTPEAWHEVIKRPPKTSRIIKLSVLKILHCRIQFSKLNMEGEIRKTSQSRQTLKFLATWKEIGDR